MAKATAVREAKKTAPFSSPSDDETIEILIPEGAESGKIPQGDQYIGKLLGLVQGHGKDSGNPMITWTFTINEGDFAGMDFNLWTTLTENSMWKLADVLTALGVKWEPGVPLKIKSRELVGTLVRLAIKDDKYQGREVSKLANVLPHPDGAGTKAKGKGGFTVPQKADDDEEEEAPRARKGRAAVEDDDEDEPPARSRRAARDEEDEDEEEEVRPAKRGRKSAEDELEERWPTKSKKRAVEDEDEEDEPAPRRRARAVADEDEDEEEEPVRKKSAKRSRLLRQRLHY